MTVTIKAKPFKEVRIPDFSLDALSFIDMIRKYFGDHSKIQVEIENSRNSQTILVVGYEDLLTHIHLLKDSMIIEVDDVTLRLLEFGSYAKYPDSKAPLMASFLSELDSHVPPEKRLLKNVINSGWVVYFVSIMAFAFLISIMLEKETSLSFIISVSTVNIFFLISWFISRYLLRPVLTFNEEEGFLQRNRDKLVWAFIGAAISIPTTKYGADIKQIFLDLLP